MQETTAKLLHTLVAERVPAIGFVNESKLFLWDAIEARTALLEAVRCPRSRARPAVHPWGTD
jgi:hypothetical protein